MYNVKCIFDECFSIVISTENIGFNPEDAVELLESSPNATDSDEEGGKIYASSEIQSSDTSDPDEAGDVDELLTQEHPVYFNYPIADNLPPSMKVIIPTTMPP